jgi:hypothetical protein
MAKMPEDVSNSFREDVNRLIRRYAKKTDISLYQIIGAFEAIKVDLLESSKSVKRRNGERN